MIKIAIVEDDYSEAEKLKSYLADFSDEHGTTFSVEYFSDGVNFLSAYRPVYDIVFMDVEMPHMLGTDTAKKLREQDPVVALVFLTNMAQYAIKGYEVNAVDYILKPVSFYRFSSLLLKLIRRVEAETGSEINIRTPGGIMRIHDTKIICVAVEDHLLIYHTEDGIIEAWGSLKTAEETLPSGKFFRVNKSAIVSFRHVKSVNGDIINVGGMIYEISRNRKRGFLQALNDYIAM